jgi:16S rRNA (adenine1518-N6/adenine1519-N6)-dimethyltransferase
MRHLPRKRFGQHFLVDPAVIAAIVEAIAPRPRDVMVEIGPGLGAMTKPLLARVGKLHVIELDRDIVLRLEHEYPATGDSKTGLTVHSGDALQFDFSVFPQGFRLAGNLPYNISTPLLFHLLQFSAHIRDMHFMLQKEVVERMVAAPSTPAYGRLSVMLQLHFDMHNLFEVPPEAFDPPPKVDSAIVRMLPLAQAQPEGFDPALFSKVVMAAFGQRRKTLRNSLGTLLESEAGDGKPAGGAGNAAAGLLEQLGIDPGLRAENLGVADFVRLSLALSSCR